MIQIRRVFTHLEEIRHEFGPVADVPLLGALVRRYAADEAGRLAMRPRVLSMLLSLSQWRQAGRERRARRALLESDREWERGLSFGGPGE